MFVNDLAYEMCMKHYEIVMKHSSHERESPRATASVYRHRRTLDESLSLFSLSLSLFSLSLPLPLLTKTTTTEQGSKRQNATALFI